MKKRLLNILDTSSFITHINDEKNADTVTLIIIILAIIVCGFNMLVNYTIDYMLSFYLGGLIIINLCIAMVLYFKYKKYTLGGYIAVLTSVIGTALALFFEGQLSFNFTYFFAIVFSLPFLIKRNKHFVSNTYILSIILAIIAITTLIIAPKLPTYYTFNNDIIHLKLRFNTSVSLLSILLFATLLTYIISKYIFALINDKHVAETEKDKRMRALYSLGHELRTQINSINGITQLVTELKNNAHNDSKKLKHYATILDGCNDQMLQLVNDVLDVHKIESGKLELLHQTRNLGNLLSLLTHKYKDLATVKQLEFQEHYNTDFSNLHVRIDSSRFMQVLENLLSNAIKYTEEGTIEFQATSIDETPKNITVRFIIKDTGVGISKEHYQTIFESFQKIKNEDTGIYGGSGLGLSLSKAILEKMDSKIDVDSTLGKGTRFSFDLTLDKANTSLNTAASQPNVVTRAKQKHILIAEDNPVSMLYTNTVLKNYGMSTYKASNGLEAIEIVKSNTQIDTILLDLEMPKMNGYDAIKAIKKMQPDLHIIAFTATKPEKEFIDKLFSLGFNDYLTKPFKKEELLEIVR